jgi:putative ABC transport system permease protein
MPALRSWQPNLGKALNQEGLAATRDQKQGRWSRVLIVGQFALVLALLAGAGLMTRSIVGLLQIHPGLDPKHVVRVYPKITDYKNRHWEPGLKSDKVFKATCSFLSDARHRIAAIPGVSASGVGTDGGQAEISPTPDSLPVTINRDWVGVEEANPLQVLRVPLKQGRWLNRSDANKSIRCVLVNQTATKQFWPGESAMGKTFRIKERRKELVYEVVGVVGDTHDMGRHAAPQPTFYQSFLKEISFETGAPFFVVRTASHPVKFYKPIGQALKAAGADLKMPTFYNLHEALWQRMATQRALMLYLSLFAGVGLFLASVGLYGVLSYNVTQRQREIGIRIALGAQIEDVTRLILRQGLTLVIWGSVLGIAAALVTGKALRTYLLGVSSTDPLTLVIGTLLLAGIALFACYMPARRAARIDPMEALRYE